MGRGGFDKVSNGQQGSDEGRGLADKLASRTGADYTLIVVAGMHYASYVAARGYDVIASGRLLAEHLVPQLMAKLKAKINQ